MELGLPEEVGKRTGEYFCLHEQQVALFPTSEIQEDVRHAVCFLVCTFQVEEGAKTGFSPET